jgi:hypothetical protein
MHHVGSFAGAACCHAIELPSRKAAPLQITPDSMSLQLLALPAFDATFANLIGHGVNCSYVRMRR